MKKNPLWAAVAVAGALAVASCGGSSSSGTTPASGHDSPGAAVMGLTRSLAARDNAAACSYFVPSEQSVCQGTQLPAVTGSVKIGRTVINGDRALVVVMSPKFCIQSSCVSNNDPNKGLPSGSTTFDQAYSATQNNNDPTTPCQRINGKWYVAG